MGHAARADVVLRRYRRRLEEVGLAAQIGAERVAEQEADLAEVLHSPLPEMVRTIRRGEHGTHVSAVGSSASVSVEPVCTADGHIDVEASVLNARLLRHALGVPVHGPWAQRVLLGGLARSSRRRVDEHWDDVVRKSLTQLDR